MHSLSNNTIRFFTVDVGCTAVGLERYSWHLLRLSLSVGLAMVGILVGDLVEDFVEDSVGRDDVHVAAAGFVGCRLGIFGLGLVLFFANLCRCRVRGVSGGLVLISTFLLGFWLLAGVVGGAKMFWVGWVGGIFLLYFVVFFIPKSVVCISFSFPSTFTNSFHTRGLGFLLFWFGLGLALLFCLVILFGLGSLGLVVFNIFGLGLALLCWLLILFVFGNLGLVWLGIVGMGLALLCWLAIFFGFGNLLLGWFGIVGGFGFDSRG
jgi:hypothetical protein